MRKLVEVGGADPEFRPSPYCWRTRMALAHKRLAFEPVPWDVMDKAAIAASGGITAPVLVEGDMWLRDSWDIAIYLDEAYPEHALFDSAGDRAKARFLDHWITGTVHPVIFDAVAIDQMPVFTPVCRDFYRERTKRKFGKSLEELCGDPKAAVDRLDGLLQPLQDTLSDRDYLGGETPSYGDYIVFGAFQWARVASTRSLYGPDGPLGRWFARVLNAFDGFAKAQPARAHWNAPRAS